MANNILFRINHTKAEYPNDEKYAKYVEQRKFFSSNKSYDFVGYVQSGALNKPVLDFVDYVHDNEKSKGLFGKCGQISGNEIKQLRKALRQTQSPIWFGFISFEEMFGKKYCNNSDQAIDFFNKQFPRFLSQAGFDVDNITWFAGLHENTNHRHIHFSFFENKPTRHTSKDKELHYSVGKINQKFLDKAKRDFELYFITNANKLIDLRNDLLQSTKNTFEKEINLYPKLARKLELLSAQLPQYGRLSYDSDNMYFLKKNVDDITIHLLTKKHDMNIMRLEYESELRGKDIEIARICNENNMDPTKYLLTDKYKSDLYRRLGNIVIQFARKQKTENIKSHSRRFEKMQRKQSIIDWLERAVQMNDYCKYEMQKCFQDYLDKLEKIEREMNVDLDDFEM